jgi:hypothetical protein
MISAARAPIRGRRMRMNDLLYLGYGTGIFGDTRRFIPGWNMVRQVSVSLLAVAAS